MLTQSQQQQVRSSFLFDQVDSTLVAALLEDLETVSFQKDEVIYSVHQFRRSIGLVLRGRLEVRKGEAVVLNTLRKGDCFGVAALFTPWDRYVTTIVACTATEVVFITDDQLRSLFERLPQTAVNYIAFLSQRIYFLNGKIDSFTAPTVEGALALYLLETAQGDQVQVGGGYAGLARQLGIGRASLYRCLDRLAERGIISRQERQITLLDLAALETLRPNR